MRSRKMRSTRFLVTGNVLTEKRTVDADAMQCRSQNHVSSVRIVVPLLRCHYFERTTETTRHRNTSIIDLKHKKTHETANDNAQ
jgi:hypothetical protein